MTPAQRTLRARIGAHSLHAQHDSKVISAPGRAAASNKLNDRLLSEIDPNGTLTDAERSRRLQHARSAHFSRLALKGGKERARRAGPGQKFPPVAGDKSGSSS